MPPIWRSPTGKIRIRIRYAATASRPGTRPFAGKNLHPTCGSVPRTRTKFPLTEWRSSVRLSVYVRRIAERPLNDGRGRGSPHNPPMRRRRKYCRTPRLGACDLTDTTSEARGTGSGRNSNPSSSLNLDALEPIPSPINGMAVRAKPGLFRRARIAYRRSSNIVQLWFN